MLPTLIAAPLQQLAHTLAIRSNNPAQAPCFERWLGALAGRQLGPGGWAAGARRADAEPLWTGRERSYDESTVRRAARAMTALGAVPLAEQQLQRQVQRAVGLAPVTAFTDLFDQVYWTKKNAWAGPVGSLANRVLACTYFGLTFVQAPAGPVLAYHLSWHKPASPLLDALEALHQDAARHRWLGARVRLHVLDRGTQGDPVLRWCWSQGIPYLTLTNGTAHWRRFQNPTHRTETGVPIFVRDDERLRDCATSRGHAQPPRVVLFPARPEEGTANGRALRYRTAAVLTEPEVQALDQTYKRRWPGNEHPIKALVAVGFDRNLDRTLEPSSSRGQDGKVRRAQERLAALEAQRAELAPQPAGLVAKAWKKLHQARARAEEQLAQRQVEAAQEPKGSRSAQGGEALCKLLALLLFNALALLLWRSPLARVRVLTPSRVRDLVLGRGALVHWESETLCFTLTALPDPTDREDQAEVLRLLTAARLQIAGRRAVFRMRDSPAILQELRIAA